MVVCQPKHWNAVHVAQSSAALDSARWRGNRTRRIRLPFAAPLVSDSYRDLTEMMQERGVDVDPSTIMRWVHRYALELEKRVSCPDDRSRRCTHGPEVPAIPQFN